MEKTSPYLLEIIIPGSPPRLDNLFRQHYHARNKIVKAQHSLVHALVYHNIPKTPLKSCRITIVRHSNRLLDWDNVVSSCKGYVDGLVHARVIRDDTYRVTGDWIVSQVFRSSKDGGPFVYLKVEGLQEEKEDKAAPRAIKAQNEVKHAEEAYANYRESVDGIDGDDKKTIRKGNVR